MRCACRKLRNAHFLKEKEMLIGNEPMWEGLPKKLHVVRRLASGTRIGTWSWLLVPIIAAFRQTQRLQSCTVARRLISTPTLLLMPKCVICHNTIVYGVAQHCCMLQCVSSKWCGHSHLFGKKRATLQTKRDLSQSFGVYMLECYQHMLPVSILAVATFTWAISAKTFPLATLPLHCCLVCCFHCGNTFSSPQECDNS